MTPEAHRVAWPCDARVRTTATRQRPAVGRCHQAAPLMREGDELLTITLDVPEACITLSGELDYVTGSAVVEAAGMLLSGTAQQITLDLAGLRFIDAAGLGHLVRLRQTLIANGRKLRLRRPSTHIARTFAAGGLRELLEPDRSR